MPLVVQVSLQICSPEHASPSITAYRIAKLALYITLGLSQHILKNISHLRRQALSSNRDCIEVVREPVQEHICHQLVAEERRREYNDARYP